MAREVKLHTGETVSVEFGEETREIFIEEAESYLDTDFKISVVSHRATDSAAASIFVMKDELYEIIGLAFLLKMEGKL